MSPRFPILSLSPPIIEQILEQCDYMDLFAFAQLSNRTFSLVQSMPKATANASVTISATSYVGIHFDGGVQLKWYFYGTRDSRRYELENGEKVVVKMDTAKTSGEPAELVFARTSSNSYGCCSNSIESIIHFIQYLGSLFQVSSHQLCLYPSELHHLSAIQSVDALKKSTLVVVREGAVSDEEMRRILEGFETLRLLIFCSPEPNFTYSNRTISIRSFGVIYGSWFKGPMLSNLVNCKRVDLNSDGITEEHLNVYLREWLNNTRGIVDRLCVYPKRLEFEEVYDGMLTRNWDLDKISYGLSSFEQPLPPGPFSSVTRRFCRSDGSIIDVLNHEERPGRHWLHMVLRCILRDGVMVELQID